MFRVVNNGSGRTPKQDAPPYDPSLWEGKDCAFITTLKEVYEKQQRMERQMRGVEQASASIPAPLSSHIQLTLAPVGLWEKFLSKFFPRYYALRAMSKRDLSHLSNEELVQRMHSALQAGEGDFSAFIAQELARRRVHLYGEEGPAPAGSAPLREGGFRREPQSSVGGVRRSGPASGVMHRRGVSAASVDSSFVVPDFLSR